MARWEFSWEQEDGRIAKRFSRQLSREAWLVADNLDAPDDPPIVTVIGLAHGTTVEDALRLAVEAANKTLRYIDDQPQFVEPGPASHCDDPKRMASL